MNAPSEDIKDILETAGVGTFANSLFIGKEPASEQAQDVVVTVYDSGGIENDSILKNDIHNPTVMVRIRGNQNGYQAAYTKAELVVTTLDNYANTVVNGTTYIIIRKQGEILFNEFDEKDRPIFSVNFSIMRRT